ncbi:ribonuclease H-like domain-containing protein [Tanacetum coccineum]
MSSVEGSQVAYLLIYVDDIILTASSPVLLQQIVDSLHKEFDMTDLGALNYFFGISVVRHPSGLFLSQKKYALQLLELAHMVNCNPSQTPVDTDSKLGPDGVPPDCPISSAVLSLYAYLREPHFAAPLTRSCAMFRQPWSLPSHLMLSATTSLVGYTDVDLAGFPSTSRVFANSLLQKLHGFRNLLRDYIKALNIHYDNALPTKIYALLVKDLPTTNVDQIHAHLEQHERHANKVRLMHECNSDPLDLVGRQIYYVVGTTRTFTPGASGSNSGKQRIVTCYNCKGEGHMSKQCTKPMRKREDLWFKDKVLLVQTQASGQILHEEELTFLADSGIPEGQASACRR